MGAWWTALPSALEPLVRSVSLALLARAAPETGGVRTHPLGPALLEGVSRAAGPGAAERARRTQDRDLPVARVEGWLGPAATAKVPATLRAALAGEPGAVVRALATLLEHRPRPLPDLAALRAALREADPARAEPREAEGSPTPRERGLARLARAVARGASRGSPEPSRAPSRAPRTWPRR